MHTLHIVPISRQAIVILKQTLEISDHLELVFPDDHNPYKSIFVCLIIYRKIPDFIRGQRRLRSLVNMQDTSPGQ